MGIIASCRVCREKSLKMVKTERIRDGKLVTGERGRSKGVHRS